MKILGNRDAKPEAGRACLSTLALVAALVFHATPVVAQQAPEVVLVRDFSRCDATFFHTAAAQLYGLSKVTPMALEGEIAYPKVQNRRVPSQSVVKFNTPFVVGHTVFVGYFDDLVAVNARTSLFSWGFLVRASVRNLSDDMRPFIWEADRLRQDGEVAVRSEVWNLAEPEKRWAKVATASGEPRPGTIERVLLLEPSGIDPRIVRFGCSVQGAVTTDILRELRPDIVPEAFGMP